MWWCGGVVVWSIITKHIKSVAVRISIGTIACVPFIHICVLMINCSNSALSWCAVELCHYNHKIRA